MNGGTEITNKTWQMQMRHSDDKFEFISQIGSRDFPAGLSSHELGGKVQEWSQDVMERFALPEGAQWFLMDERHPSFMMAAPPELVGI